jgi:hypothetical protein
MKKIVIVTLALILVTGCARKPSPPQADFAGANEIAHALQDEFNHDIENTDAMIEEIYARAKEDAKNITPELTDKALAYLAVNFTTDPFDGNLIMESCLYFGALLDKAYDDSDIRSEVGWDAFRAIKYVYRGIEAESDASSAISQVLDGLLELGYVTRTEK